MYESKMLISVRWVESPWIILRWIANFVIWLIQGKSATLFPSPEVILVPVAVKEHPMPLYCAHFGVDGAFWDSPVPPWRPLAFPAPRASAWTVHPSLAMHQLPKPVRLQQVSCRIQPRTPLLGAFSNPLVALVCLLLSCTALAFLLVQIAWIYALSLFGSPAGLRPPYNRAAASGCLVPAHGRDPSACGKDKWPGSSESPRLSKVLDIQPAHCKIPFC